MNKVEKTIKSLQRNNMNGHYVKSINELHKKIKELINEGDLISFGGSMTLHETNTLDLLRQGNYKLLDRYTEDLTRDDILHMFRESFFADVYFSSTNAVTLNGELYNVDGNGNRVAALIFGPKKVIIVAGTNKIVDTLEDAVQRNRMIAAPLNTKRLNRETPCYYKGSCQDCVSPHRICQSYTTIKFQGNKDRIHVIFIEGNYGY